MKFRTTEAFWSIRDKLKKPHGNQYLVGCHFITLAVLMIIIKIPIEINIQTIIIPVIYSLGSTSFY